MCKMALNECRKGRTRTKRGNRPLRRCTAWRKAIAQIMFSNPAFSGWAPARGERPNAVYEPLRTDSLIHSFIVFCYLAFRPFVSSSIRSFAPSFPSFPCPSSFRRFRLSRLIVPSFPRPFATSFCNFVVSFSRFLAPSISRPIDPRSLPCATPAPVPAVVPNLFEVQLKLEQKLELDPSASFGSSAGAGAVFCWIGFSLQFDMHVYNICRRVRIFFSCMICHIRAEMTFPWLLYRKHENGLVLWWLMQLKRGAKAFPSRFFPGVSSSKIRGSSLWHSLSLFCILLVILKF